MSPICKINALTEDDHTFYKKQVVGTLYKHWGWPHQSCNPREIQHFINHMYPLGFYRLFAQPSRCWVFFRNQQVPDELWFHKNNQVFHFIDPIFYNMCGKAPLGSFIWDYKPRVAYVIQGCDIFYTAVKTTCTSCAKLHQEKTTYKYQRYTAFLWK